MVDFKQKYIQYYPDGSGRDSYINANSGGFSRFFPKQALPCYNSARLSTGTQLGKIRDLSKTSWTFKYKSDGSGRDSYVIAGSGGLQSDYKTPPAFKEALRCGASNFLYKNINSGSSNSKVRYISKDEYVRWKKLSKIQENVINRLYNNRFQLKPIDKTYDYSQNLVNEKPLHRVSLSTDYRKNKQPMLNSYSVKPININTNNWKNEENLNKSILKPEDDKKVKTLDSEKKRPLTFQNVNITNVNKTKPLEEKKDYIKITKPTIYCGRNEKDKEKAQNYENEDKKIKMNKYMVSLDKYNERNTSKNKIKIIFKQN